MEEIEVCAHCHSNTTDSVCSNIHCHRCDKSVDTLTIEKKEQIVKSDHFIVPHDEFLFILGHYDEVRGGILTEKIDNSQILKYTYVILDMEDVKKVVKEFKEEVTYSVMYNSRVDPKYKDKLYIHRMRSTILDNPESQG